MFTVFRHHDYSTVGWFESILEAEGIATHVKNKHSSTGITEVPIPEFYPELCVTREEDVARAIEILKPYVIKSPNEKPPADWQCSSCQESVPGTMGTCWNCDAPCPDESS